MGILSKHYENSIKALWEHYQSAMCTIKALWECWDRAMSILGEARAMLQTRMVELALAIEHYGITMGLLW